VVLQFILEKREDSFKGALRANVIGIQVSQMEVKFQKPREEKQQNVATFKKRCILFFWSVISPYMHTFVSHI
jgi:hypothetical protein